MEYEYGLDKVQKTAQKEIMRPFHILIGFMIALSALLILVYGYLTAMGLLPYADHLAQRLATSWEGLIVVYYLFVSAFVAIPFAILSFIGRKKCLDIGDTKSPLNIIFKFWGFVATNIIAIVTPMLALFLNSRDAGQMHFLSYFILIASVIAALLYYITPKVGQVSESAINIVCVAMTVCGIVDIAALGLIVVAIFLG